MALRTSHSLFFCSTFVVPVGDAVRSLPYSCSGKESDHANDGKEDGSFSQQKSGCVEQSCAFRVSITSLNDVMMPVLTYALRHTIKMVSVTLMLLCP